MIAKSLEAAGLACGVARRLKQWEKLANENGSNIYGGNRKEVTMMSNCMVTRIILLTVTRE